MVRVELIRSVVQGGLAVARACPATLVGRVVGVELVGSVVLIACLLGHGLLFSSGDIGSRRELRAEY